MFATAVFTALKILAFKAGPQDVPYSPRITQLSASAMLFASYLQYQLTLPAIQAAAQAVAGLAVFAGFTWALLHARKLANRTQQTLNALFLTNAIVSLLLLPAMAELAPVMLRVAQDPKAADVTPLPAGPTLLVLALSVWNFAVSANIFRHALGASRWVGAAAALLTAIVTVSMASSLGALVAPGP
jgi:hypothetical protein